MMKRLRKLAETQKSNASFGFEELPLRVPPRPWSNVLDGGFLNSTCSVMRSVDEAQQHVDILKLADEEDTMGLVDILNCVSSTAWKINEPMLDLILKEFNRGGGSALLKIPETLACPPLPPRTATKYEQYAQLEKRRLAVKTMQEQHSLRSTMNLKLSVAKHVRGRAFWLPTSMDFRGRCYPVAPHLHHLSGDAGRAMMLFARGLPLGKKGLDWLKVHLVSLLGTFKAASFAKKLAYVNSIIPEIIAVADDPFQSDNMLWKGADKPWMTIATCMDIAAAIRSGNPETYVSYMPVHQDGSCNGLQHYAALGRDKEGAAQVNLEPLDSPGDVYQGVADMVEAIRAEDTIKQGPASIPAKLEGLISRKLVKQTVMTVVYGVTFIGAKEQVIKRLTSDGTLTNRRDIYLCAVYVVTNIFRALDRMFSSARQIQSWFLACADRIVSSGKAVHWKSPLGMSIIQPYHKASSRRIMSTMQSVTTETSSDITTKPDRRRQMNAFPPNFIHSLDAAHMMLSALHCNWAGITFASVHDSYWTHAGTVDIMSKITREQFVKLHEQPLIEELGLYFQEVYGQPDVHWSEDEFLSMPDLGDFDLNRVKDSIYFFS